MSPKPVPADGALHAPERNRFFYGKLMDVAQFEKEQSYFRRQQWMVDRFAIGSGVIAGLNVTASAEGAGMVHIEPGVAIDPAGRLIVVHEAFSIDAHQLTDAAGEPVGAPLTTGTVEICIAYAEAGVDPVAVLTPHCDAPGDCSPSTIREEFLVLVRNASAPSPNYGCTLGNFAPPPDPALWQLISGKISGAIPPLPVDLCVPLARVNLDDGSIDAFTGRPFVPSNSLLWQLLVCLAQNVGAIRGAMLRYNSGDNQTAAPSATLPAPLTVELVDGMGNPVSGAVVQFQPAAGTVSPTTAKSDSAGRAQTKWKLGAADGDQTLTASATGSVLTVTFHAQAKKG